MPLTCRPELHTAFPPVRRSPRSPPRPAAVPDPRDADGRRPAPSPARARDVSGQRSAPRRAAVCRDATVSRTRARSSAHRRPRGWRGRVRDSHALARCAAMARFDASASGHDARPHPMRAPAPAIRPATGGIGARRRRAAHRTRLAALPRRAHSAAPRSPRRAADAAPPAADPRPRCGRRSSARRSGRAFAICLGLGA